MIVTDFEYDGRTLSDFGYILCNLGSSSTSSESVDVGSNLAFTTVSQRHGTYAVKVAVNYDGQISKSFQICKNPCKDDFNISDEDFIGLMRWLNRKEFHKLRLLDESGSYSAYYDASFNLQKIKLMGKTIGVTLSCVTNRPFGYSFPRKLSFVFDKAGTQIFNDPSDEIGDIYPTMKVTSKTQGSLTISGKTETDVLLYSSKFDNLSNGEEIIINGVTLQISTSLSSHNIANDFNYDFPIISNSIDNRTNKITVNGPCVVELTYSPIVKNFL